MTTGMAWCPVSNIVIIKKQSGQWRGMVSRRSRSFSERSFLNLAKKTKADMIFQKKLLENFSELYKRKSYNYIKKEIFAISIKKIFCF